MSQEQNESRRRARRAAARQRNRPTLVTANDAAQDVQGDALTATAEPFATEIAEQPAAQTETTTSPTKPRRRGFFSTIGKKDSEEDGQKEADVAQARLARATRGKAAKNAIPENDAAENKQETAAKKPARPATRAPEKPASAFKTRYIIGMALYLLCANFVGAFEVQLLRQYHLDQVLTRFNLFGGQMVVSTSTVAFIATLIIILVVLAKLDLIPSTLGLTPPKKTTGSSSSNTQSGVPAPKFIPPAVRQGVTGEDDDLYQEYRSNQRRTKKR